MKNLFARVESGTKDGKAKCLCIMGSMPPGCGQDTYAELTKRLINEESLVLIDSVVGLNPLLDTLSDIYYSEKGSGGVVLKLNAAELCKLANVPKKESERVTMDELKSSTSSFSTNYNIKGLNYLCITDGKFPAYLVELAGKRRTWQMNSIDLSEKGTLYPIGAGDTVAAGTLAAWHYLHSNSGVVSSTTGSKLLTKEKLWCNQLATAFAFGIACGTASCLREENSVFSVDDAENFLDRMSEPVLME